MAAARRAIVQGSRARPPAASAGYAVLPCIAETAAHERMVELRRWFHQHPELSYQESETAKFIVQELRSISDGFLITEGVDGTHGIIADLEINGGGATTIMLRA